MADEGLDIAADGDDFATANRIRGTVDPLLSSSTGRYDANGEPLTCQDCRRPLSWDEQRGDYRHLVDPARGCLLIRLEDQHRTATQLRRDRLTERLDQLTTTRRPASTGT